MINLSNLETTKEQAAENRRKSLEKIASKITIVGDEGHHTMGLPDAISAGEVVLVWGSEWTCDAVFSHVLVVKEFLWKDFSEQCRQMRADHEVNYPPFKVHVTYEIDFKRLIVEGYVVPKNPIFECEYLDLIPFD